MAIFQFKTRQIITLFFLGCLFSSLLLAVPPVKAAGGPKMQVKAGFDSYYKLNSWLPLQVNLSLTEGNPNFEGWLEASFSNFDEGSTVYRRAVQLVPPSNRQVWFYLPSNMRNLMGVQVRLTDREGSVMDTQDIPIRPLDQSELVVGVISDNTSALAVLNSQRLTQPYNKGSVLYSTNYYSNRSPASGIVPSIRVAHLSPSDLPPEASGWDSLDGLVLTELSSINLGDQTLNQASLQSAAAAWLAQGRFLFTAGDSTLHRSGFLGDFLPVKSSGTPQNKAFPDELRQFLTEPTAPAKILMADTSLLPGATAQLSLDGKPLLAEKPFGLGRSWFAATDFKTLPDSVLTYIWKVAFQDYEPHLSYLAGLRQPTDLYRPWPNQLNPNTKVANLPDVRIIGLILVIYILLLGPVAYFSLKKLGKRELGWIVAPILALALTAGFYIVGVVTSGEPLVISRLSIVILGETAQGKMVGGTTSIGTLYSSSRLDLQINVTDQAQGISLSRTHNTANQLNNRLLIDYASIQQGPGGGFGKVFMGQDDQRSFALENDIPPEVGEGIVARLTSQGNELVGTIENRSGTEWSGLKIWKSGNMVYQIPTIKAGEKITLQKSYAIENTTDSLVLVLTGLVDGKAGTSNSALSYGPLTYQSQEVNVLSTLLGNEGQVLPKGVNRVYLIGWKHTASNFPLQIGNHPASPNDLMLLFEPLVIT